MEIGLALNKFDLIPTHLFNGISKFCKDFGHHLFIVPILKENKIYKKEAFLFRLLLYLESYFSVSKYQEFPAPCPICNDINILDVIICWKNKLAATKINSKVKIFTFYIDEKRLDTAYSFLDKTFKKNNFILSIHEKADEVYSLSCTVAKTYSRNREISILKLTRILVKILNSNISISTIKTRNISVSNTERQSIGCRRMLIIALLKMVIMLVRNAFFTLSKRERTSQKSFWDIHIGENNGLLNFITSPISLKLVKHDSLRFWADPFLYKYKDKMYLFIEEYKYENKKGEIAVLIQNKNYEFFYGGVVLSQNYHLSFPYIFEIKGNQYMIPESGSQKRVDIFKCNQFPHKWSYYRTLLSGYHYCDTTVFKYDGLYWIFTSAEKDGFQNDEQLLLFYTDDILNGILIEHPCNPISVGLKNSRMAGAVFFSEKSIVRPAQDCSVIYGGGIRFMKVEKLTKDDYIETEFATFKSFNKYKGTHTFNQSGKMIVIDAY